MRVCFELLYTDRILTRYAVLVYLSIYLYVVFVLALNAQKPIDAPTYSYATGVGVDKARVDADVEALHQASKRRDENVFCEILVNRSDGHLGAVVHAFGVKYKSLSKVVKKTL